MKNSWQLQEQKVVTGIFGQEDNDQSASWLRNHSYLIDMIDEHLNELRTIVISEQEGATDKVRQLHRQGYRVEGVYPLNNR